MKIKTKINVALFFTTLFVLVVLGFILGILSSRTVKNEVFNHLETAAQSRKDHLETYFGQNIERLKLVSSRTKLRQTLASYNEKPNPQDLVTIKDIIVDAVEPIDEFERICVISLEGEVLVSTDESYVGTVCEDKNFYRNGLEKESIFFADDRGEIKMYVSGPMVLNDQVIGVIVTVVNLDMLNQIVSELTGMGETGEILVAVNDTKTLRPNFLTTRRFEEQSNTYLAEDTQRSEPMVRALQGTEERTTQYLDYRGIKVGAVTKYIDLVGLGLVAKMDISEILKPVYRLLYIYIIASILFIVFVLIVTSLLSRKISEPIIQLQKDAEIVSKGGLDHVVSINSKDEVGNLAESFNKMIESIKKSHLEVDQKVEEQTEKIRIDTKRLEDQRLSLLNVLEDVQREKDKANGLARDLKKFQLAVAYASDHIVITDIQGIVLYANEAVTRITGFTKEEVIGKKAGSKELWGGLMDKPFYEKLWNTISVEKKIFSGEITNKRKNGEQYSAWASISPVLDEKRNILFYIGIERDITKEKQLERMKDEFVSIASHELRTPMTAIKGFVSMILEGDYGQINKEIEEPLTSIRISTERLIHLVNDLLNLSRIEAGRLRITLEEVDASKIVSETVNSLLPIAQEKGLELKVNTTNLTNIQVDTDKLRQIIVNLVGNSLKFTDKGYIEVKQTTEGNFAKISVIDTGIGIPETEQERVFGKFEQIQDNTKGRPQGTGLGLYICKMMTEKMGGTMRLESSVEAKGSVFSFTIPLVGSKEAEDAKQKVLHEASKNPDQKDLATGEQEGVVLN